MRKTFVLLLATGILVVCLASMASATWLRSGIVAGQPESASIYLNTIGGNVAYTSSTGTSVNYVNGFDTDELVTGAAWAITGAYGDAAPPVYPLTYVETSNGSASGLAAGTVGVGRVAEGNSPFWYRGAVVWHVVAPTGRVFNGGTAVLNASGEGVYGWIWPECDQKYEWRLFSVAPTIGYNYFTAPDGTWQTDRFDTITGPHNAYPTKDLTVSIPTGLSEFWVAFDSYGADKSTSAYFSELTISGTLAPVPEPSSMLAFGTGLIGLAGFVIRRRK